jgi:hypothetical protein
VGGFWGDVWRFDLEEATRRLRAVDAVFSSAFSVRFLELLGRNPGL